MCLRLHLLQDRRGKFGAAIVNFLKNCFTVIRPAMLRQSTRLAKPITRVERVDDVGPALAVHPSHHRRLLVLVPPRPTVLPHHSSIWQPSATARCLGNVISEHFTRLVAVNSHTYQHRDVCSCPTTPPRFGYAWNFEPAPRCCWVGITNHSIPHIPGRSLACLLYTSPSPRD